MQPPAAQRAPPRTTDQHKVLREFAASGISVCIANVATNPIEVIKTRMMLRQKVPAAAAAVSSSSAAAAAAIALHPPPPPPGFFATGVDVVRHEGAAALARGVQASALRGITFGGIRLGLYGPIKDLMTATTTTPPPAAPRQQNQHHQQPLTFGQKLLAGSISGGVGAYLTNPFELVKTRCQAGGAHRGGPLDVARQVLAEHGAAGLWHGAAPGVARSTLLNASMCATYDEAKGRVAAATGWAPGGLATTFAASMASGLVTTTVINPVDVLRAYMQTGKAPPGASAADLARRIWAQEGPAAFMKGWSAAYMRTGPQCVMIFLTSEALRPAFGLKQIA